MVQLTDKQAQVRAISHDKSYRYIYVCKRLYKVTIIASFYSIFLWIHSLFNRLLAILIARLRFLVGVNVLFACEFTHVAALLSLPLFLSLYMCVCV